MPLITDCLVPKTRWRGYIKTIALGCSLPASSARLCVLLDCDTPGNARKKVAALHASAKITQDDAMTYLDAISDIERMYEKGIQTHTIPTPPADWHDLGGGCHQHRNHGIA